MKATLTQYGQSPRKVRLVVNAIRGKSVANALAQLSVMNKRAAAPIEKLVRSAVANAKQNANTEADTLFIKEVRVEKGVTLKRSMPAARGTAHPIHKHRSQVYLILGSKNDAPKVAAKVVKEKAPAKEKAVKAVAEKKPRAKVAKKTTK
jgi:large subunit ribosomal protein L22